MKKITKRKADKIFEQVARQNKTTIEEVKREIELAALEGMKSQDPAVQQKWREISPDGTVPAPEVLLAYLAKEVK